MHVRTLALVAVVFLTACSGSDGPMNGDSDPTDGAPSDRPDASDDRTVGTPPTQELRPDVAAAMTDLAERMGIAESAIEFVEHRNVTWSDGSLGCPEPGMMYTQALVPGVWIHFRVDGEDHHYHGARGAEPFYCPAERADPPPDNDALA